MSATRRYRGLPVSEGTAVGVLHLPGSHPSAHAVSAEGLRAAFAEVTRERSALAAHLRESGRDEEAEIVGIGALMAADPALVDPAVAALRDGADAVSAVEGATAAQAALIAALPDPDLASRAEDVRQVAGAVLAHLTEGGEPPPPGDGFILVRHDVDPADLIRFAEAGLAGAVSVSGGANSHAAIIARGLGVPMLAGCDPQVLAAEAGSVAILDATAGELVVEPSPRQLAGARPTVTPLSQLSLPGHGPDGCQDTGAVPPHARGGHGPGPTVAPGVPAADLRTRDGQQVTLLCNVASAAETRLGLAAGAAGVGLLRTEIPFAGARAWPTEAEHRAALEPVMALLAGRPAVVRLLDFSGDKVPPFLAGTPDGLTALLGTARALRDQIRAVLRSGQGTRLAVMVPMVQTLDQVGQVREALTGAAAEAGTSVPELGMMVEVAAAAAAAADFAPAVGFFSVGTNDLTSQVLGIDRADPRMRPALAADPRVLGLVAQVVNAATAAGVKVSVCGDAAADPAVLPLLLGLGVATFSVGAARLPQVAEWVAQADTGECAALAAKALAVGAVDQSVTP